MRLVSFALLGVLATACAPRLTSGPRGFWHTNRLNRQGDPIGRWRYYTPAGSLVRQEQHRPHGLSDITYYHPNGQVARQGQARISDEADGLHFYWFGEWLTYSETGLLQQIETYQNGRRVATQRIQSL